MSFKKVSILVAFVAVVFMAFGFQNSSEHKVLFEKAKFTMETKGDLKGAIKLFREIIQKYPGEREYAAKSQLYIGLCYEKLGLKQSKEAQKAYQKVVDNYPEQIETINMAKEKLITLTRLQTLAYKSNGRFNMRRAWEGSGWWRSPSLSPLGGFFAFSDRLNGYGDVAIYDLSSGKVRRLTNDASRTEGAHDSVVSPDGKQIAYMWRKNDGSDELRDELRVVGIDDSKPRTLYRDKNGLPIIPFHWSADGRQILVFFKGIAMVSVDDGSVRVLKKCRPDIWGGRMRISPNGRYIAYNKLQEGDLTSHAIFILASDGSYDAPLFEHTSDNYLLDWCPDGKSILFASNRTGSWCAWQIRVKEGKPDGTAELVKRDLGLINPLGFTRDGSFYFHSGGHQVNIYTAEIDVRTGKILESPKNILQRFLGGNRNPAWSPDGKNLAYISAQVPPFSQLMLRIRADETGKEREVFPQLGWFDRIQWFPDGSSIKVYGTDAEKRRGLFRVDIKTGNVEPILMQTPESPFLSARLGPHGKTIYYCSYRTSEKLTSIMAYNLQSGQEKEIWRGKEEVAAVVPSPDGQWLAMGIGRGYDAPAQSLAVMPASGGEMRELLRYQQPAGFGELVWTPDSEKLLFTKVITESGWGNTRHGLWIIPMGGGIPKNLNLVSEGMWHLTIHPDGRHIAYTSAKSKAEIWVMENFLPELKDKK